MSVVQILTVPESRSGGICFEASNGTARQICSERSIAPYAEPPSLSVPNRALCCKATAGTHAANVGLGRWTPAGILGSRFALT